MRKLKFVIWRIWMWNTIENCNNKIYSIPKKIRKNLQRHSSDFKVWLSSENKRNLNEIAMKISFQYSFLIQKSHHWKSKLNRIIPSHWWTDIPSHKMRSWNRQERPRLVCIISADFEMKVKSGKTKLFQ